MPLNVSLLHPLLRLIPFLVVYKIANQINRLLTIRTTYQNELAEVEALLAEEKYDTRITLDLLRVNRQVNRFPINISDDIKCLLEKEANLIASIARVNTLIARHTPLVTEAESEGPVTGEVEVNQTLTDVVGDGVDFKSAGPMSDAPDFGQKNLLRLDDFFSRPITIDSFTVAAGAAINASYEIWDLYTKSAAVRAKLRNYAFFRADLHVRVAVSGSPFHYGKALISYQPYGFYNQALQSSLTNLSFSSLHRPSLLCYLSQSHGAVTIDYNGNQPVEIKCPFIAPKGVHKLYNQSTAVLASASSYDDLAHAGQLHIRSINNVAAATASPTAVGFHIYAWLENVELGPPTGTQIVITTEAGDERVAGPVEKVATMAANVSSALSVIPGISYLAKASQLIFQGVAGVSSWFGWSKPAVVDDPHFVKNRPYANSAFTIGRDTVEKISFDPKQEITVDPRVCASAQDEMSVAYLTSISSYLTTFSWDVADVSLMSMWESVVTPTLSVLAYDAVTNQNYYQPTALAYAASCFTWWRGSMKFRLEIVASRFHRGKIGIMYEPNINQQVLIDSDIQLNLNYIKVIDIQETQDVEFCIEYCQPYPWLQMPILNSVLDTGYGTDFGAYSSVAEGRCNGYITVFPFTQLQSPDGSSVSVNVYICGEKIEFNQITPARIPQTRDVRTEAYDEHGDSPEVGYTCFSLNNSSDDGRNMSEFCFGEQPMSLRSILKRYGITYYSANVIGAVAHSAGIVENDIYPKVNPKYGGTLAATPDFFSYMRYAYLGIKGGMRKRIILWDDSNTDWTRTQNLVIALNSPSNALSTNAFNVATGPIQVNYNGGIMFNPATNGGIEVELPFYSNNLFLLSFEEDLGIAENPLWGVWSNAYTTTFNHSKQSCNMYITEYSSAAEDFTFMRFVGAPYYTVRL